MLGKAYFSGVKIIDLRSDTVTKPSPAMREAMMSADVGDDVFGEDPTVNRLQDHLARMFKKDAAMFVPSGTMGNQICVKLHSLPGNEIICEADCHIFKYEAGGAGLLSGVQTHLVTGDKGVMTADQIERAVNSKNDIHTSPTALIALENTHNRAGGTVYPLDEIKKISDVAKRDRIPMHLDGARLFNACVAADLKPSDYSPYFDTISICFSKGLGAPVGSAVIGSAESIARARYFRKALGGGMRQAGILAAAAQFALDNNVVKLKDDHRRAHQLAEAISKIHAFHVDMPSVQTNIVIFDTIVESSDVVVQKLAAQGVLSIPFGPRRVRLVTHLDLDDDDISRAITIFKKTFGPA